MRLFCRFFIISLTMVLLFTLLPTATVVNATITQSTFDTKVQAFINDARWKHGLAWGDNQAQKLSSIDGVGDYAYACDFVGYVYGATSTGWNGPEFSKFTDLNEIRVGDVVHTTGHWFIILGRNGNSFYTAEANFDDKVRICSDGWAIKNGAIHNLKAANSERTFEYGFHYNFAADTTLSSSQIFYPIDMSKEVLASRINQQVDEDCAVVSMATIESYLYGATSSNEKNIVYNALVTKNKDDNYAYWSNCGYDTKTINWTEVYNQLAKGYPTIVHRPANGSKDEHWAVVVGYNGSSTTLEKDKFIMVDVYHGSGRKDIMTSGEWRANTNINRMAYRKNGIAITTLSGIRFAIDHPTALHKNGNGHGVYGYITSNTNLQSVHVMVTNTATAVDSFNTTVTPNAKSYKLFNLDADMTFAKWPDGEYLFTVVAQTERETKAYQTFFRIAGGWPKQMPTKSYTITFDTNGGQGTIAAQTATHNGTPINIPAAPVRTGYEFTGWTVKRVTDGRVFCIDQGWCSEADGYTMKLYAPGEEHIVRYDWLKSCMNNTGFVFTAQWKKTAAVYNVIYDANGGSAPPASQSKTEGVPLTLSTVIPVRSGYTFNGWSTKQNATTASYTPGSTYTNDANITLYALWTESHTCKCNLIPRQNATCTNNGKNAYYLCNCGKCYEDSNATKLISDFNNWGIIKATGHKSSDWKSDEEQHWKVCSAVGCGAEISGTRAAHAGGTASCTTLAKCSHCQVVYGTYADHVWGHEWHAVNQYGHAKKCQIVGCSATSVIEMHTPGIAATETTPQTCTDCGHILQAATGHIHALCKVSAVSASCEVAGNIEYYTCSGCSNWFADATGEVLIDDYNDVLIPPLGHDWAKATCTSPRICNHTGCGATSGLPLGHTYGLVWSSNNDGHMHACSCGSVIDMEAHCDDNKDRLCDLCHYELSSETPEASPSPTLDSNNSDGGIPLWTVIVLTVSILFLGSGVCMMFISRRKK